MAISRAHCTCVDGLHNTQSSTRRVQPLLAHHGDECSQQGDHKTRVHEAGDSDNLARRSFLNRRNCGSFTGDGRLIESEDGTEGSGLLVRIGLEVRVGVDDERRADGREQTRLWEQVRYFVRTDEMVSNVRISRWC